MYEYPKRFGDSGPDWIIDLETQDGHPYNLLKSIEKVMDDPKYAIEAMNGEHFENPDDCPYTGYERILDYILSMCPEIEMRMYGETIQQVHPCYNYALDRAGTPLSAGGHKSRGNFC